MDGVCDLGIVGQNVLEESALERRNAGNGHAYSTDRVLDFGGCRLAIAVPEERALLRPVPTSPACASPTTYPRLTARFFAGKNIQADIVTLSGSVEVAPRLGLAEAICDLVATGSTLEANRLRAVETIFKSKAALIRGDYALTPQKQHALDILLRRIDGVQLANEAKYIMLHAPKANLAEINSSSRVRRIPPCCRSPATTPRSRSTPSARKPSSGKPWSRSRKPAPAASRAADREDDALNPKAEKLND